MSLVRKKIIQLHQDDNVAIALVNLSEGEMVDLAGENLEVRNQVRVGHKLCLKDVETGQKIIRNQVSIGSATVPILVGEHVHLHNLGSDYIQTLNEHYTDRKVEI